VRASSQAPWFAAVSIAGVLLAACGTGGSTLTTRPQVVSPTASLPPFTTTTATSTTIAATTTGPVTTAVSTPAPGLAPGVNFRANVPAHCTLTGPSPWTRPDPSCTPGTLNPAVTPETIDSTICVSGYSTRIRPPESFTYDLKRSQMTAWGLPGFTRDTEEDHYVPLSLGGAPSDSSNLWPEPGGIPNQKDKLEYRLYRLVCDHQLDLRTAQIAIASDWTSAYRQYVGPTPGA